MKVKHFPDTDTAHVEFTDNEVHDTKEISQGGRTKLSNCYHLKKL